LHAINYDDNASNITWLEKNEDFEFYGEQFDIVSVAQINNKTVFYCIKETKEQELMDQYSRSDNVRSNNDLSFTDPDHLSDYTFSLKSETGVITTASRKSFADPSHDVVIRVLGVELPPPNASV